MKVLFDQGVPAPLRRHLSQHGVDTAFECGWSELSNGALLDAAEQGGYEVFVTTDQNLKHQQHLAERTLAILVLSSTAWPRIQRRADEIAVAIAEIRTGEYVEFRV